MVTNAKERLNIIAGLDAEWHIDSGNSAHLSFVREDRRFDFTISSGVLVTAPGVFVIDKVPVDEDLEYEFSFNAVSRSDISLMLRVVSGDIVENQCHIEPDKVPQKHIFRFRPSKLALKAGFVKIEFVFGFISDVASLTLSDLSLVKNHKVADKRRVIAVCGIWEDSENYNSFLSSLVRPDISKDYVIASFTFTQHYIKDIDVSSEIRFADLVNRFDVAAIVLFIEMLKSKPLIDSLMKMGKDRNIPVIAIERRMEGTINGMFNYSRGFEEIVRHVIEEHNTTDVKMFAGIRDNDFSIEREEIFKKVMKEKGIEVTEDDILYGEFYSAKAKRELRQKLEAGMKLPKAFICANDSMAVGVCDYLRTIGVKVPSDVIVTGFDGARCGKYHSPVITTCEPDFSVIGDELLKVLSDPDITDYSSLDRVVYIDYKLVLNGSCGCHPRTDEEWSDIVSTLSADNQDYFNHDSEMGLFITRFNNIENIDSSIEDIDHALWLWPKQYFFIGLTDHEDYVHALFRGYSESSNFKEIYHNYSEPFPEIDEMLSRNSGINIILTRQIRANSVSHGYVCSALSSIKLRDQQRFEEFGTYISTMVNSVMNLTGLMEANDKIKRMSERDYLTGLYNRRGFLDLCNQFVTDESNYGKVFTFFSVDMDGLKYINDTFGHFEGDRALKLLAQALNHFVRNIGIAARYGGDEFAVAVVTDKPLNLNKDELRTRAAGFLNQEIANLNLGYKIFASIGISSSLIDENINLDRIMNIADEAMYSDKKARKKGRTI
ncbi:MAG: diguanylate cyclase [Saccharofermentans sp.]|nr:diguanylate cyclase [Saccharofermentans sp.]